MMDKPRVLIIEDNIDLQEVYRLVAEAIGYAVEGIDDGQQALDRLEQEPLPTLVLLDAHIPLVKGADVLIAIRSKDRWSEVPVYIMTADRYVAQVYRSGTGKHSRVDGVIEKGSDTLTQLREVLDKYKKGVDSQ
jgi:CheY-like chemotaxis protein